MNYQIQGLSIHAEVHGTAEPALVFSITGLELTKVSPIGNDKRATG